MGRVTHNQPIEEARGGEKFKATNGTSRRKEHSRKGRWFEPRCQPRGCGLHFSATHRSAFGSTVLGGKTHPWDGPSLIGSGLPQPRKGLGHRSTPGLLPLLCMGYSGFLEITFGCCRLFLG